MEFGASGIVNEPETRFSTAESISLNFNLLRFVNDHTNIVGVLCVTYSTRFGFLCEFM